MTAIPLDMTPEKLRSIADWLDTYDTIIERVIFTLHGDDAPVLDGKALIAVRGKEVQDDLRRWAGELDRLMGARCVECGHVQYDPNWCERCGHRTEPKEATDG